MLGLKRLQCPTTLSVRYILSAALILSVFLFNTHAMADTTYTMLGRSSIERSYISLSADDWDWLRKKRVLELGVPQPDFPPFEMTAHSAYYEGITADVAGMLSQLLNIEVKVSVMPDRTSALVALGYKPQEASRMVSKIAKPGADCETLIRDALRAAL